MRKRVIITTIVSFILLLAVVLAGLNAIFTVTSVRASFRTYSADGKEEAARLQETLNGYVGRSLTFLDLKSLEKEIAEYPYFRIEEISKKYPDKVEVNISERQESLAYLLEDGSFATLDEAGEFLRINSSLDNRVAGKNLPLIGFGFRLKDGRTEGRYFDAVVEAIGQFRAILGEVRANIVSVELHLGGGESAPETHYFRLQMREGVVIDLYNPQEQAAEKARGAVELYTGVGAYEGKGLNDAEKTSGVITVNLYGGVVVCNYQA